MLLFSSGKRTKNVKISSIQKSLKCCIEISFDIQIKNGHSELRPYKQTFKNFVTRVDLLSNCYSYFPTFIVSIFKFASQIFVILSIDFYAARICILVYGGDVAARELPLPAITFKETSRFLIIIS